MSRYIIASSTGRDPVHLFFFFFSSRRRHTRLQGDWSSDVCSSDLTPPWRSSRERRACGPRGEGRSLAAPGARPLARAPVSGDREGDARERPARLDGADRKSTRLNSSHLVISYAVFCLQKKNH